MKKINTYSISNINQATKWSFVTEIASKIVSPVVNMILARLLSPNDFGIVATVVMVTSFADIFSTAGLTKYLVHHEFVSSEEKETTANTAFFINIGLSILFWIIIIAFKSEIAILLGTDGHGNAIAVGAAVLPMTAFSSVQMALFQKGLDFKTLFFSKIIGILSPFFITVPLAFLTKSFWAMIIGNLCVAFANAFILTIKSEWKPQLYFKLRALKQMMRFCIWTFLEQLLGWANLNIGIFIVSNILNTYYLGLYKTSMAMVNQVMAIFTTTLSAIVLATLSACYNEQKVFLKKYFYFQKMISMFLIPIGCLIFIFRDTITMIILGSQWLDAAFFIGLWGFMSAISASIGGFVIEVLIAIGKPKYGTIYQILNCLISIPILYYFAHQGFDSLCTSRGLLRIFSIFLQIIMLKKIALIPFFKALKNQKSIIISTGIMVAVALIIKGINSSLLIDIVNMVCCIMIYIIVLVSIDTDNKKVIKMMLTDFRQNRRVT